RGCDRGHRRAARPGPALRRSRPPATVAAGPGPGRGGGRLRVVPAESLPAEGEARRAGGPGLLPALLLGNPPDRGAGGGGVGGVGAVGVALLAVGLGDGGAAGRSVGGRARARGPSGATGPGPARARRGGGGPGRGAAPGGRPAGRCRGPRGAVALARA